MKALKLGPRRLGLFTWLALFDQKLSMWTPLFGVVFFGIAGLLHDPVFLLIFALWVAVTRTVHSLLTGLIAARWHPLFPILTYYGQIVGAAIKLYVSFNPNVQKWTRQNTGGSAAAMPRADSAVLLTASVAVFAAGVMLLSDVTSRKDRFDLSSDTYAAELIHAR